MQRRIAVKAVAAHRAEFHGATRVRADVERELAVVIYRPGSEGQADLFEVVDAANALRFWANRRGSFVNMSPRRKRAKTINTTPAIWQPLPMRKRFIQRSSRYEAAPGSYTTPMNRIVLVCRSSIRNRNGRSTIISNGLGGFRAFR